MRMLDAIAACCKVLHFLPHTCKQFSDDLAGLNKAPSLDVRILQISQTQLMLGDSQSC